MFKMPVGLYEKGLPPDLSWEERLTAAGKAGYDFVEVSIDESEERLARLDWPTSERIALRHPIEKTGVRVMSMCLSGHRKYPLGSRDPQLRQRGLEILRKAITFAADIGLSIVQVMAYDVFYEPSDEETQARFMDGLQQGVLWAAQSGVMLGIENLDTPFVENLSQALAIVNEVNSPWLHLYSDIGNLAAAGYNVPDELALGRDHLIGVHIKDTLPRILRGVRLGEGIVPFQEVFRTLAQSGFWGVMCVERWCQMHPSEDPFVSAVEIRRQIDSWVTEAYPAGPIVIQPVLPT